jgi:hypothetical protein
MQIAADCIRLKLANAALNDTMPRNGKRDVMHDWMPASDMGEYRRQWRSNRRPGSWFLKVSTDLP